MEKINGQYFTIYYYFGEYHVGQTKVYNTTMWSADEDSARAEFKMEYLNANIKYIQS